MRSFTMDIGLTDRPITVEVTVTREPNAVHYRIWPKDKQLQRRFGAQVCHQFTGKPVEAEYPEDKEARYFATVIEERLNGYNQMHLS